MEILYSINIRLSQNVSNDNNEKDSKFLETFVSWDQQTS